MKRLIAAGLLGAAMLLGPAAGTALAGVPPITSDSTAIAPTASLTLSEFTVLIVVSFLIPLATGLLTKLNASATVKQILTAAISTVVGIIESSAQSPDGGVVVDWSTVQYALLAFAVATIGYLGVYKAHDTNAKLLPARGLG